MSINIAIVDDHPMVIDGIRKMMENTEIHFQAGYTNGRQLLEGLTMLRPDVLLLDIQMPGSTGKELLPQIKDRYPELRVIVLSGFDHSFYVNSMLHLGALGYVLKSADRPTMLTAIKTVYEGQQFIDPALNWQQDSLKRRAPHMRSPLLTKRELQVIQLLAEGLNNPDIAEKLSLSARTIKNYRLGIYIKLDVTNLAQLLKKAGELQLI